MNLEGLARNLSDLAQAAGDLDLTEAMRQARDIVQAEVKECFEGAHTPGGVPWPPLKEPDRPWSHRPLILSGDLMTTALRAIGAATVGKRSLRIDTEALVDYWRFQNAGTSTIPARRFLGVSDEAMNAIGRVVVREALKKLSLDK